jgi:PAS domain S-box-containing protein
MLRLLIVDDNPDDRTLTARELRQAFAEVQIIEVGTAAQFEQALARTAFDVVITDYQLHWNDGITILRIIKAHYPDRPVIMFTNTATQAIALEAMKLGLDDYVIKSPSHYARLPAAVESALERVAIRQQAIGLQARLQTLLNQLDVGVYRLKSDGTLLEGNTAFLRLLKLGNLTELPSNQTLEPYFQPQDYAELLAQLKQNGEVRDREIKLRCADGTTRWVKISKSFTRANGITIIDGLMEDISDRKQAEAQAQLERQRSEFLAEASQLLTSSLEYRQVLNSIAEMAVPTFADWCVVDIIEGTVVDFTNPIIAATNPEQAAFIRQLRQSYPPSADLSYGVAKVLQTGEPEWVSEFSDTIPLAIAQDETHLNLLRQLQATSYMIIPIQVGEHKLGTIAFVSARADRLYDQADLEMALELSRRAAIALDNARLYQEAQEASRVKDEFLAIVSHELRNPLNSMLGWAQVLRKRQFDDPTVSRAIEIIARNTRLQNKLIEDLLDVSRIIQNQLQISRQPVYLAPIVEAAIETLQPNADAKAIRLTANLDPTVGQVLGDAERLEQIVSNLLSNAIKFTPGGGQVEVRLSLVMRRSSFVIRHLPQEESNQPATDDPRLPTHQKFAQITIIDTGQGIRADFLPFIFDRFRQADASKTRAHTGLGLGLAIVHHLVELHDGSVYASSEGEGKGATFTVQLPLLDFPSVMPEDPMSESQEFPQLAGLRILVIDDDLDNRELVSFILEQQQAQVTMAASAAEAFDCVSASEIDLLICDIGMPDEDGYSLMRRIRTLPSPEKRRIPAIALTAFAKEEDQQEATAAGFQRHLSKPINPDDLIEVVASLASLLR